MFQPTESRAAAFGVLLKLEKLTTSKSTLTDSLEGVDPGVPAQQLQQFIVETEGEGDTQGPQTDVGENCDGTELEHTGQTDHQPREHHTGPPHVPPVHQIHNCTRRGAHVRSRKCQHNCSGDGKMSVKMPDSIEKALPGTGEAS